MQKTSTKGSQASARLVGKGDSLEIAQEIDFFPYWQMVHASVLENES